MIRITLTGPQGQEITGAIRANRGKLRSDWLPDVMRAAGMYVRQVVLHRQFESEGGYLGSGWQPFGDAYGRWKERMFGEYRKGHRTQALRDAMTSADVSPFSRSSFRIFTETPTTVHARPILQATAETVTIGAEVTEEGVEYSRDYDTTHGPIFGTQRIPSEVEAELGKLLSLPYMAACQIRDLNTRHDTFPDAQLTAMLSSQALREVM